MMKILLASAIALVALSAGLALLLPRVPVPGEPLPDTGVGVYVCSNGTHTDIVMPAVTPFMDWFMVLDRGHFPAAGLGASHLAFGWGERRFYLETPTWADATLANALHALVVGEPTVMHVHRVPPPAGTGDCGRLVLEPERYRRLATAVLGSFRLDGEGRALVIPGSGYGPADTFYEAVGRYSVVNTCNEWTGRALRAAGVTMGVWTPLAGDVMRWVPPGR